MGAKLLLYMPVDIVKGIISNALVQLESTTESLLAFNQTLTSISGMVAAAGGKLSIKMGNQKGDLSGLTVFMIVLCCCILCLMITATVYEHMLSRAERIRTDAAKSLQEPSKTVQKSPEPMASSRRNLLRQSGSRSLRNRLAISCCQVGRSHAIGGHFGRASCGWRRHISTAFARFRCCGSSLGTHLCTRRW